MKDYVLRKIYRGEWRKVDKQIVKWRREKRKREALAKAEADKPKLRRDILAKNLFGGDDDDQS